MKTIQIQVPDMQSNHCQMRVKQAVNNLPGAEVTLIQAGNLEVELRTDAQEDTVIAAIQQAGYTVAKPGPAIALQTDEATEGETFRFSTNVNCGGCLAQIRPALDAAEGICHWEIDTSNPKKILTVHSEGISREEVIDTVQKAGFSIQEI